MAQLSAYIHNKIAQFKQKWLPEIFHQGKLRYLEYGFQEKELRN